MILNIIKYIRVCFYRLFSDNKIIDGNPKLVQPTMFIGNGRIKFGKGVVIGTVRSPGVHSRYSYFEAREKTACISIGNNVWMNNNVVMISNSANITISDDVLLGWNVEIIDSDFHSIDPKQRKNSFYDSRGVMISRNVWVGSNVTILKGVRIGENTVIASGSVVVNDIPENVVAAGVPAKVIKTIK